MLCIAAFIIFSILGIFSAKYRNWAALGWQCVFRRITFRKCDADTASKIKMHLLGGIAKKNIRLAAFLNKRFEIISWIFVLIFAASTIYTAKGIYNLTRFGTCSPENPAACPFSKEHPRYEECFTPLEIQH